MTRIAALALALVTALGLAAVPASAGRLDQTPYGLEDNPIGTIGWLPANANESAPGGQSRLIVVFDRSLDDAGAPIALKAKGTFGAKFFTTNPDVRMAGHSPDVTSLDDVDPNLAPADPAFMGVAGDVRSGACSKAGTASFSEAYTTTRSFFHAGTEPYAPVSEPGTCEVVDDSVEIVDGQGNILGYQTTVSNHVPGFWVDVTWPTRPLPIGGGGYALADVYYGTLYDTAGEDGEWYTTADAQGQGTSTGSPGDYSALYRFTAGPGATGAECVDTTGEGIGAPDSWEDVKVVVPANATKVTFRLFPKADWDLIVINPDGIRRVSGDVGGFDEEIVAPASGTANFPDLVPGEYTMRGCNFTGEQSVLGGVIIQTS